MSSRTKEIKITPKFVEFLCVVSFKVFQRVQAISDFLSLWEHFQVFLRMWFFNCVIHGSYQLLSLYRIGERWLYEDGSFVEWYWPEKYWSTQRSNCPAAALSTTNYTWKDLEFNLGFWSEGPKTDRLYQGCPTCGPRWKHLRPSLKWIVWVMPFNKRNTIGLEEIIWQI
jgi:hypothetical protein